jgi:hypothetical protein
MLCAKFISVNTRLRLVDCTPAICCEKCEVTTYSGQKMSLKAAKFPPQPTHTVVISGPTSHGVTGTKYALYKICIVINYLQPGRVYTFYVSEREILKWTVLATLFSVCNRWTIWSVIGGM